MDSFSSGWSYIYNGATLLKYCHIRVEVLRRDAEAPCLLLAIECIAIILRHFRQPLHTHDRYILSGVVLYLQWRYAENTVIFESKRYAVMLEPHVSC